MHRHDRPRHDNAIDDDAFRDHLANAKGRGHLVDRDDRETVHHHFDVVELDVRVKVAAQPSD